MSCQMELCLTNGCEGSLSWLQSQRDQTETVQMRDSEHCMHHYGKMLRVGTDGKKVHRKRKEEVWRRWMQHDMKLVGVREERAEDGG